MSQSRRAARSNSSVKSSTPKRSEAAAPSVRLALCPGGGGGPNDPSRQIRLLRAVADDAPTIRLAHVPGAQGDNVLLGQRGVARLEDHQRPAILVSFFYLRNFLKRQAEYAYRNWALDSGAYSADNSGVAIRLDDYIAKCKELLATDPTLVEIFSLDVIGDWKASLKNTEKMWKAGVPAIPCYHSGEPEHVLLTIARDYPKIALGNMANLRGIAKERWCEQCFARIWPKPVHGFGAGGERLVMKLPWHSTDATNWQTGPCAFGRWNSFGAMSVRGSDQNLRAEVEWYLRLEAKARRRWQDKMMLIREDARRLQELMSL